MENNCKPGRFKRGGTSPDRPGLVFIRYKRGQEQWGAPEILEKKKEQARKINAKRRKTPEYKAKMRDYFRTYNHTPKQKKYHIDYYAKPEVKERARLREFNSPERISKREARAKWRAERSAYRESEEHKEKLRAEARDYYVRNKPEVIRRAMKRMQNSPSIRIKQNLSRRIRQALEARNTRKSNRTVQLLGCSIESFKLYLQSNFEPGMSWDAFMRGEIHIDHELPCALFDLTDPEQQKVCFHFSNLQPLWADDNRKKSDRMPDGSLGRKLRQAP